MTKVTKILNVFMAVVMCFPALMVACNAYLYLEEQFTVFSSFRTDWLASFGITGSLVFFASFLWIAYVLVKHPVAKRHAVNNGSVPLSFLEVQEVTPVKAVDLSDGRVSTYTPSAYQIPFDPSYDCEIPQPHGWSPCTRGFHMEGPCNPRPLVIQDDFGPDEDTVVQPAADRRGRRLTLPLVPLDPLWMEKK